MRHYLYFHITDALEVNAHVEKYDGVLESMAEEDSDEEATRVMRTQCNRDKSSVVKTSACSGLGSCPQGH
ncbi:hypothetical protein FOZ63_003947 [Perkinsus olseni]|uniref:Uncharacterized protein n=1 Tax=Perkinsus olseni TaxID=32597 RepID=A0A7J6N829_PEROL|nr:hypothetical protein FOZ63_003947 [Perkinsus olseni]